MHVSDLCLDRNWVESFIEHQDACNSGRIRGEALPAVPSTLRVIRPAAPRQVGTVAQPPPELQLLPASTAAPSLTATAALSTSTVSHEPHATTTKLQLSVGPAVAAASDGVVAGATAAAAAVEEAEELRRAMEEKAAADAARQRARDEAAAAERALEEARRARQRARAELEEACGLRDHAARLLAQVTCHACRQRSLAVSMAVAVGGEGHGGAAVPCDSMRGGGVGAGI